jgi:hypothetical protein
MVHGDISGDDNFRPDPVFYRHEHCGRLFNSYVERVYI